jgi:uncharacterized 2Fe-2S/4Fe-4S cluster protein (DUF4445 family)
MITINYLHVSTTKNFYNKYVLSLPISYNILITMFYTFIEHSTRVKFEITNSLDDDILSINHIAKNIST